MARSDKDGIADGVSDQVRAAHREGAQKKLANRSVRLHDVAERTPIDLQHITGFARAAANQRAPARQVTYFAGKRSRAEHPDPHCIAVRDLQNLDAAAKN